MNDREQEALIESLFEAISPLREFYVCEASEAEMAEDKVVGALEDIINKACSKAYDEGAADTASMLEDEKDYRNQSQGH